MQIWPHHLYSVSNDKGSTGFCAAGARRWWAFHDLSWADFVAHGIDEAELLATGDPRAVRVVEHAHALTGGPERG